MGLLMVVGPGVKVKSIEGDTALADRHLDEQWPYLGLEAVAVHAEIRRCVPEAN